MCGCTSILYAYVFIVDLSDRLYLLLVTSTPLLRSFLSRSFHQYPGVFLRLATFFSVTETFTRQMRRRSLSFKVVLQSTVLHSSLDSSRSSFVPLRSRSRKCRLTHVFGTVRPCVGSRSSMGVKDIPSSRYFTSILRVCSGRPTRWVWGVRGPPWTLDGPGRSRGLSLHGHVSRWSTESLRKGRVCG